jgi:predicted extracellular nuclease
MRFFPPLLAAVLTACDSSAATTPISAIQGAGNASPIDGQEVTVEGIVTGDFQDGDSDQSRNLGGFYVQDKPDGNDATSDGIFVFDGNNPATDVNVGDRVRISGKVAEYYGETQIQEVSVTVTGSGTVVPSPVTLPAPTTTNSDDELIADLERFEGMLVTFPQTMTVSQLRNLERFGEIMLRKGGRQYSFTNLNVPDVAGFGAHVETLASRQVFLDDGQRNNNPGITTFVRNGDEIADVTGVLRYSRGSGSSGPEAFRLMPTVDPEFNHVNPRPGMPDVAGSLRVATFNVDNFFSGLDNGSPVCGPDGKNNCRGANSDVELSRQLAKIVTVLETIDADIVAIIELENNVDASLRTLVDSLNASTGSGAYDFVNAGTIGDDGIKVGLIFKPGSVQVVGNFAVLDNSVDVRFDDGRHRPVLAQTFESVADGERLTVLALHLKSKGSSCETDGDPDIGDGQGNCSATRSLAAAAMIDWIATDPTSSGDDDYLVIGDFNTHTMGEALTLFESAGYVNVAAEHIGYAAYSFEFKGQFGALDHAMASPGLAGKVIDAAEWHINADEARLHDYNLEFGRDPALFDPATPYRASDHDPLIIGIGSLP